MAQPPTGEQHEIRHGEHRAVVTELGGALRLYEHAGRPVVDGYDEDASPVSGKGQVLVPWPNRVDRGRYTFAGADLQLALTEVAKGNASHGLTRWVGWQVSTSDDHATTARVTVHPQPGYPFAVAGRLDYELGDDGLTVTATLSNVGGSAAPVGMGFHPYVAIGNPQDRTARVDDVVLQVPAARWSEVDDRGIPCAHHDVDGTDRDFRTPRPVGPTVLDTPFTDLTRGEDGRWRVRLQRVDGSVVTVWGDDAFGHLQLFTADAWSGGPPRTAIAVEPMTCAPDAFNSGEGLVVLEPGESLTGRWGIAPG